MQHLLYASLHFQTCGILQLGLLNLQGLVFSVHMSFLQLNDIESVTSQLFNLCHHKNSLPSALILYRLCENLLEC